MYSRKNGRVTFKSNRRTGFKRNINFSNPKSRNKGNINQQYNKYIKLAKEAFSSGDRIQAEYYYQFTDHYYRLMVELGINFDENSNSNLNENKVEDQQNIDNQTTNQDPDISAIKKEVQAETEISDESIESVPFLSDPVKKKRARSIK